MRMLFGKYWWIVLVAVVVILALAVVVQYTKDDNDIADWIFVFLDDWSMILSAGATLLLVFVTFMTVRENRHISALSRLKNWANEAIRLLTISSQQEFPLLKLAELKANLQAIKAGSISALADSKQLGRELESKVKQAYVRLEGYTNLAENTGSSSSDLENAREKLLSALIGIARH